MSDWAPVDQAAKDASGNFQVLTGGQWRPAAKVAKNAEGKFMALMDDGAPTPTAAPPVSSPVPLGTRLPPQIGTIPIPGQEGEAARVASLQAQRPQPGLLDRLKGVGEAFIDQALGMVGGGVGAAGGLIGGVAGALQQAREQRAQPEGGVERSVAEGAQRGAEALRQSYYGMPFVGQPSKTGQEYSEQAGQFIAENAPSIIAGPAGVVGLTSQTRPGRGQQVIANAEAGAAKADAVQAASLARPELESIRAAHDAGYKLTPKAAKAGVAARVAETAAGSARLSQELAAHNAENTARLARRDVGLPDDVPATPEATAKIREEAGQDYAVLKDVGQFENDAQYTKDLNSIIGPVKAASEDYPGLLDSPLFKHIEALRQGEVSTASAVEAVKQLRSKADVAFRAGDKRLGGAYRAAAEAVDGSMDRALGQMADSGDPALAEAVDKYRAARVRIAKTYLLDDAMDGKPGEVNAKVYARALKKGVPLTGDALQIAEFGKNFADEGLAAKKGKSGAIGPTWHDIVLGAFVHAPAAAGGAAAMIARPLARRVLGSDFAQRRMAGSKPGAPVELPPLEPADIPPPPPKPETALGFEDVPQGQPAAPAGPLGDPTPDWQTAPGVNGRFRPGEEPGLVPAVGDITPAEERGVRLVSPVERPELVGPPRGGRRLPETVPPRATETEIPAVPGRPDLPDTMVAGAPGEVGGARRPLGQGPDAATEPVADVNAASQAMQTPEAALARQRQAEALQQRAQTVQSPEVKRVLETQAAKLALEAKRMKDAHDLRMEAAVTDEPAIRQALLDHAKRLERAEKVAIGEAKEGMPKEKPAKAEKIPAGDATEVPAEEVVAPNPDLVFEDGKGWVKRSIPTGEATELPTETVVYDAKGRALEVGRTYTDSKGRRAVWQADGTWKILK